jgi:hypothetical protein
VSILTVVPALDDDELYVSRSPVVQPQGSIVPPLPKLPPAGPDVTPDQAVKLAKSQLGISGRPNRFTRWYSAEHGNLYLRQPWCAIFLAWLEHKIGYKAASDDAYTPTMATQFEQEGRWGSKPRVGAYVFFDWGGSKSRSNIDHVGLVVKVHRDGSITSIEGNSSDSVAQRRHSSNIVGYGYPTY